MLVFSKMCSVQIDQSGVQSLSVLNSGHWFVIIFAKLGFYFSLGCSLFSQSGYSDFKSSQFSLPRSWIVEGQKPRTLLLLG